MILNTQAVQHYSFRAMGRGGGGSRGKTPQPLPAGTVLQSMYWDPMLPWAANPPAPPPEGWPRDVPWTGAPVIVEDPPPTGVVLSPPPADVEPTPIIIQNALWFLELLRWTEGDLKGAWIQWINILDRQPRKDVSHYGCLHAELMPPHMRQRCRESSWSVTPQWPWPNMFDGGNYNYGIVGREILGSALGNLMPWLEDEKLGDLIECTLGVWQLLRETDPSSCFRP